MAMTFDQLMALDVLGRQTLDPLFGKIGMQDWQLQPGGNDQAGNPIREDVPSPEALKAAQAAGMSFDWQDTGDGNTGTLIAYNPDGSVAGQWQQQDQSTLSALKEFGILAAAGFGGLGALGFGPAAGLFGGGAAAGGVNAGAVDAAALGLDGAAGAAGAAGGAAGGVGAAGGGLGLTEAVYGAGGALGSGAAAGGLTGTGIAAGGGGLLASLGGAKGLLPVGASLLGTGLQMNAASKARDDMQAATSSANALQKYMYDTTRADNMPALQARNSALQQMQALLSDPSSITKAPDYQFGLDQGTKALSNSATGRGMTYSGQQAKALQRYGQDYAGSKITESANRLMALASGGQPGAGQIAGAGQSYAGNVGNALMSQGDANGAYRIAGGNALADTINGLTAYGVRKNWWGG